MSGEIDQVAGSDHVLKSQAIVAITLLTLTASCATKYAPQQESSLDALVNNFAAAREDALGIAMTALDYDGVIVPHELGRSRVLSDAILEDINGIPGRELWFRVKTEPCYPKSSLIKQLPGWERLSETILRTSNSRFTIQMSVEASEPECVSFMRFWKRDSVS